MFNPRRLLARLALLAAGLAVPALVLLGPAGDDRPSPAAPMSDSPAPQPKPRPASGTTSNRLDLDATTTTRSPVSPYGPDAAAGPFTLGDDPALDVLWRACEGGEGAACDELFERSPLGSEYERFGVSCGYRPRVLHCTAELTDPAG